MEIESVENSRTKDMCFLGNFEGEGMVRMVRLVVAVIPGSVGNRLLVCMVVGSVRCVCCS